jgi:hypothetical protein
MLHNMGTLDRKIRAFVIAPAAVIVSLLLGPSTAGGLVLLGTAAIMVATAAAGFCPLYKLARITTTSRSRTRSA